jgi:hypothetical protein
MTNPSFLRRERTLRDARSKGILQMGATYQEVEGQMIMSGQGETTFHVEFPIKFRDRPKIYYSVEVAAGVDLKPGYYPEWSLLQRRSRRCCCSWR